MAYLNDQILKSLREARQRKGLSQRKLSAKSGVPQSHISKIESGAVDLRVSSLIALARVLDLELELVPKKAVPAVRSIVRSSASADLANAQKRIQKEMQRYKEIISALPNVSSVAELKDLESLRKAAIELEHVKLDPSTLNYIVSSRNALEAAVQQNAGYQDAIKKAARQMRSIRDAIVHSRPTQEAVGSIPAYRLDGGEDD